MEQILSTSVLIDVKHIGNIMEEKKKESMDNKSSDSSGVNVRRRNFKLRIAGWMLLLVFFFLIFPIISYGFNSSTGTEKIYGIVQDSNDEYLENTIIEIIGKNITTETDKNGSFEIDKVPEGEVEVKFYKEGFRVKIVKIHLFDGYEYNLSVSLDYYIGIIKADELKNGTISGNVTKKDTLEPINNVSVNILSINNKNISKDNKNLTTKTNENGNYLIDNIPVGIIEIRASIDEYNTTFNKIVLQENESKTVDFTLKNGNEEEIYDNVKGKFGIMKGEIMDKNNSPISHVNISILTTDIKVITNVDGSYSVKIPYGKYKVKAEIENYPVVYKYIVIDNETYLNFTLENGLEPELKDDIPNLVVCYSVIGIFSVIILLGGICSLKRKLYAIAFIGSLFGVVLGFYFGNPLIIVLSVIALSLIWISKEEFTS